MRKVISWVLALAMVLTSFSMAFAKVYPDTKGTACENAVNVLSELGVITGYEDGSFKPEQVVTRAEASKLIISALGLTSMASGAKASFTDLDGYGWASGYIGYAQSLGILKGDGNGKFRPGDTVNYNEMATIILRALGYTDISLQGTWPANYVTKAKNLNVFDDITGAGGANGCNRGDVAIMIYNVLGQEIGYINNENQWVTDSAQDKNKSDTMYKRLGVKNQYTERVITEKIANDALVNVRAYVGAYASCLLDKDDKLLSFKEVKSTFLTGRLKNGKFVTSDDVEYELEGLSEYTPGVEYFYNGSHMSTITSASITTAGSVWTFNALDMEDVLDLFQTADWYARKIGYKTDNGADYTISVKLSGKTIKALYSILDWDVTAAKVVTESNCNAISNDKELLDYKFKKNDNLEIDTTYFILNGVDAVTDITKDHVVYVYENMSGYISRVDVGPDKITGEITKKTSTKYTIGGNTYKISTVDGASVPDTNTGKTVDAYLSYDNKIFKMESSTANDDYAILLQSETAESGKIDAKNKVKIFKADGSDGTYEVDDDVMEKDYTYVDKYGDSYDLIKNGNFVTDNAKATDEHIFVIKYSLSSKGVLDTFEVKTMLDYYTSYLKDETYDITSTGKIDGTSILDSATMFTVKKNHTAAELLKKDAYDITTLAKVKGTDDVYANWTVDDSSKKVNLAILCGGTTDDATYGVMIASGKTGDDYFADMLIDGVSKPGIITDKKYETDARLRKVGSTAGKTTLDVVGERDWFLDIDKDDKDTLNTLRLTDGAITKISDNVLTVVDNARAGTYDVTVKDGVIVYEYSTDEGEYSTAKLSDVKNYDGVEIIYAAEPKDEGRVGTIILLIPNGIQ